MITWQQIVDIGLCLEGCELSTSYGRPALKVGKKMFACTGKQDDHFVLMIGRDQGDALIENDPDVFFLTPHYERSRAVLVRYEPADPEFVEVLLERAAGS